MAKPSLAVNRYSVTRCWQRTQTLAEYLRIARLLKAEYGERTVAAMWVFAG